MPSESNELTRARELLGKFEAEMGRAEGIVYLSEGLTLLTEVRESAESDRVTQIAANIALTYAKKARAQVEAMLGQEPPPHWEIVAHWQEVLAEFRRSGFSLPDEIGEPFARLLVNKLTPEERQELLVKLQAMDRK